MTVVYMDNGWAIHAEAKFTGFHSKLASKQEGSVYIYAYIVHDDIATTCEPPELGDYRVTKDEANGRMYRVYMSRNESDLDKYRQMHRAAVTTWTDLFMPGADSIDHAGELYESNLKEVTP